jgi:hypothetical protein
MTTEIQASKQHQGKIQAFNEQQQSYKMGTIGLYPFQKKVMGIWILHNGHVDFVV